MTQIPNTFTKDNYNFTKIKRSNKAAIYQRSTLDGGHVNYEVFALKSKGDTEIYPDKDAGSLWSWYPVALDRAEVWFDRINNGDVVIPEDSTDESTTPDMTIEEVLAAEDPADFEDVTENDDTDPTAIVIGEVIETVPTVVPVIFKAEPAVVEVPISLVEDPTVPSVVGGTTSVESVEVKPEVLPTVDGGAVVTVAKVRKARVTMTMVIPQGEFTQAQFAVANGLPERGVVYSKIQNEISANRVKLVEMRKVGKGRPSAYYSGV